MGGLAVNELILNSSEESFKRKPGFRSYLDYFPLGSLVHNISLSNVGHGLLCRSRGSFAKILQSNFRYGCKYQKKHQKKECRLGPSYGKSSISKGCSYESCRSSTWWW